MSAPGNLEKNRARSKEYYLKNRARLLARNAARRVSKQQETSAYQAEYRRKNAEAIRVAQSEYRRNNKHKQKAWVSANLDKARANTARRKAQTIMATPSWANHFFISEAYHLAVLRSRATGYSWHVDHIVPLRSKKVCGLHVEHNLRVIPGVVNLRKQNRYWPDMPGSVTPTDLGGDMGIKKANHVGCSGTRSTTSA